MKKHTRLLRGGFLLFIRAASGYPGVEEPRWVVTRRQHKTMKKLGNSIGILAVAALAAVFTGCADEGGDEGGGNQNPPAPEIERDVVAADKIYTINLAGQRPITLTFPVAGSYQTVEDGTSEI